MVTLLLGVPGPAHAARRDPVDRGAAIDLLGASLMQQGTVLRWTVRTRAPVTPGLLGARSGQHLCLRLFRGDLATPRSRVCLLGGAGNRLALRDTTIAADGDPGTGRALAGTVRGATTRTVTSTFDAAALGLDGRRLRWQVDAASVNTTRCAGPVAAPCVDVLPDVGTLPARTVVPRPIGCVTHGASQLTRIPGAPNAVALTFDDGPGSATPQVLAILRAEHVPATFFVVGGQIAGRAGLLRRMLADGHAIGNHTYTHANMAGGGNAGQITHTQQAIRAATGYTPCVFRPPYGATSGALVGEVRRLGLTSVLWSVDPRDWSTPGAAAISARILSQARRGAIVLMHDGGGPRSQTVAALRAVIHAFKARGYRFVTVPDALGYRRVYGTPR